MRHNEVRIAGQPADILLRRFQRPQAVIARQVSELGVPQELTADHGPLLEYHVTLFKRAIGEQTFALQGERVSKSNYKEGGTSR